jgi:hypothetical protein
MCGPVIQLSPTIIWCPSGNGPFSQSQRQSAGLVVSALYRRDTQTLDFIDLGKNCLFLKRTLASALFSFMDGHNLIIAESQKVSSGWQIIKRQRFWLPDFKDPHKIQIPNPLFNIFSISTMWLS